MSSDEVPPSFYLNTHAADADAAAAFFTTLGFTHVPKYSDDKTKSFRLPAPNNNICLMTHAHDRFKMFMRPKTDVNDATKTTECLFSVAVDSKEKVDEWVSTAVKAGGTADPYIFPEYGAECGMYTRSFADLDGHIWEVTHMYGTCEQFPEFPDLEKKDKA